MTNHDIQFHKLIKQNNSEHLVNITEMSCYDGYSVLWFSCQASLNLTKTKICTTQHVSFRQAKQIRILQLNLFKQIIPQVTVQGAMGYEMKFIVDNTKITKNTNAAFQEYMYICLPQQPSTSS